MEEAQIRRTDRLLFDYLLVHGRGAYTAEAPMPAQLPAAAAGAMLAAAPTLYRLLLRAGAAWPLPPFPLREAILAQAPLAPPLWARFDGFCRAGGGVFFAEVNFDKPGGHREALADPAAGRGFRRRFQGALRRHWQRWGTGGTPRAAILVDPAHREELHLAHLYAALIRELGWPVSVAGPLNLGVRGDQALAFGQPFDLLLRQFPTEFLHEVPAMAALLDLQRRGRLAVWNDPGAIIPQAKTSFAWLWQQCLAGALNQSEAATVRAAVPFTAPMTAVRLPSNPLDPDGQQGPAPVVLLEHQERWVLKPVLGRYSYGVAVGALVAPERWGAAMAAALAQPDYWVAQAYVPIAPQPLVRWGAGGQEAVSGYVNWGLHFLGGRAAGWIARCSATPLTDDAWFAGVAISPGEEEE